MNPHTSPTFSGRDAVIPGPWTRTAISPATRADNLQRAGQRMILSGFLIAIAGVVAYCLACFAAGMSTAMEDVLFKNDVPFARATLSVLGAGTIVWIVGSITYLRGAMDADEEAGPEDASRDPQ